MRLVHLVTQEAADNPGVYAAQCLQGRLIQVHHVDRIAEGIDAKAQRMRKAVVLIDQPDLHAGDADGFAGGHLSRHHDWPEEARWLPRPECVTEATAKLFQGGLGAERIQRSSGEPIQDPHEVQAALLNSRRKFAVVRFANASGDSWRTSASTLAVCAT